MTTADRKPKPSPKPQQAMHEIINLDDSTCSGLHQERDLFIADLAMHCGGLLNWVGNTSSSALVEALWKNETRVKAAGRFPELDCDEVRKLVDRDWKVMSEEARNQIIDRYSTVHSAEGLQNRANQLRSRINLIKESNNLT